LRRLKRVWDSRKRVTVKKTEWKRVEKRREGSDLRTRVERKKLVKRVGDWQG